LTHDLEDIAVATPNRVMFVMPDLGGGGAQRVMLTLARGLDRRLFDLHLAVLGPDRTLAGDVPMDVAIHEIGAVRLRSGLLRLIRLIGELKPRLVVSVMGYINLALLAARPLLPQGTRLIVREANVLDATLEALPRWMPAAGAYKLLYPMADAIVAPTKRIAAELQGCAPRAAVRIVTIPNPVLSDMLYACATPPVRPVGDGLVLVAAGRLTRQKGFERLIELVPQLPSDARLTIYGDGPDRAALRARITALGIEDRVVLPGFRKELPAAIAGADLFLLPSRWEGLPNVTLESLALGTPVIASDEAGVEDIARAAPPGAMTIAKVDESFVATILQCKPMKAPVTAPRPSLLPAEYEAPAVTARFAALFEQHLHG
jgi:glycosyltransferase involved in cell wall biosynthesis